jgi:subtilisin family serine protease
MMNGPGGILRAALFAFALLPLSASAQQSPTAALGDLQAPPDMGPFQRRIAPQLLRANGQVQVWVQLQDSPLATVNADAKERGAPITAGGQRAWLGQLRDQHDALSWAAASLGGRELGRVSKAHNAVAFSIDASNLPALAAQPGVLAIRPVIDYSIELSETVPYIGATAVQNLGYTGAGVRVAVLDSGIDYTHRNLGGPGTAEAYTAAFGSSLDDPKNKTVTSATGFPTAKVIGGYDFVGEHWPVADLSCGTDPVTHAPLVCLAPDPNPIACGGVGGCDGTHGTHVSDIIAGRSNDGAHKGVAPGAALYALKVCSSVSTSCSGVALLQAMEFALDPNGDGDLSDAVDVINMSLGSDYGQVEDDLTLASENAVRLGVVVATAAGNAADKPYIVSSPSIGPGVISVAQTQVPGAKFFPLKINSPASIAGTYNNTATVDWAPITAGFTGDVAFVGRGCPATATTAADPYLADPAGKVALIDRGVCAISLKVDRATKAGAIAVLIGLVAAGDAVSFSFGGGDTPLKQTLVIIQADAARIKTALAAGPVNVTVPDAAHAPSLVKSMASTSARGPSISYQTVKPEIGAPGASVSAVAGTGTGEAAFGGTSGATPMIAGSAALLLERYPHASPFEIKARLMNTAETGILTAPGLLPGQVAPVSRIGAGEVRVDRAMAANTFALSLESESAAVSFGYAALGEARTFNRKVLVFNRSSSKRTYRVSAGFRDPSNPATLAATLHVPSSLHVSKGGIGVLEVRLSVDPARLNAWNLNGGSQGGNGQRLNALELDGEITISDAQDTIHVPWHMLPHRAADVSSRDDDVDLRAGAGTVQLRNGGVADGFFDVFAWTGTSKKISRRLLPRPGDNFAVIDLGKVGVRQAVSGTTPLVQFAISTFGKRAHPNYPAEFDIYIDANRDGTPDFVIFNLENGGFGASGQNVVEVVNLKTGAAGIFFFADADLNSSNMIMTAPMSAVGLTPGSQFNFSIYAFDNYFTGNLTDAIENMTFSFAQPRFAASGVPASVPAGGSATFAVTTVTGGDTASPSQKGLLLLYRDAARSEAQGLEVETQGHRH